MNTESIFLLKSTTFRLEFHCFLFFLFIFAAKIKHSNETKKNKSPKGSTCREGDDQ